MHFLNLQKTVAFLHFLQQIQSFFFFFICVNSEENKPHLYSLKAVDSLQSRRKEKKINKTHINIRKIQGEKEHFKNIKCKNHHPCKDLGQYSSQLIHFRWTKDTKRNVYFSVVSIQLNSYWSPACLFVVLLTEIILPAAAE